MWKHHSIGGRVMKAGITGKSFVKVNKDILRKVKVQDLCKKPYMISLAQCWIKKDRDQSKSITTIKIIVKKTNAS